MRSGQKIPMDIAAGEALQVPSRRQLSMLLTLANAILQGKVVRSSKDGFHISDENALFELKDDSSSSAGAGFPFQILQPHSGTANFRDIQVNAGNLWAYPSPEAIALGFVGQHVSSDVDNFNTTITLPASAAIYVFIGWTLAGGWAVYATDTDDGSWQGAFGATDNKHFVIGFIDALTNAGSQTLIVSQYVSADVTWPISGEFTNTLFRTVLTYTPFGYVGGVNYIPHSSVVKGTVGDGFPANGTYLYTNTGTDVGPGNDWIAF